MAAIPVADSRTLRTHRALAYAHARIASRDSATIRTQVAVSQIAAPTGDERERGDWFAARLRSLGLRDARIDHAGNVVATRSGLENVAPVLVCAHLDTVFARDVRLTFRRDGERVTGPGIGDNGRGLAAMLAIAEEMDGRRCAPVGRSCSPRRQGRKGAGDLRGAKYLFSTPRRPARCGDRARRRGRRADRPQGTRLPPVSHRVSWPGWAQLGGLRRT